MGKKPFVVLTNQYLPMLLFMSFDRDRAVQEGKRYADTIGAVHELQTSGEAAWAISSKSNSADVWVGAIEIDSLKIIDSAIRWHKVSQMNND